MQGSVILKTIARVISVITHPVLVIWLGTWYAVSSILPTQFPEIPTEVFTSMLWRVQFLLFIVPALVTALYLFFSPPRDWFIIEREKRLVPMGIHWICLGLFIFIPFEESAQFVNFYSLLFWIWVLEALFIMISLWYKISLHAMATGFFASIGMMYLYLVMFEGIFSKESSPPNDTAIILCISIIFLVPWSRYYLGAHTQRELSYGFLLGLIFPWVTSCFAYL